MTYSENWQTMANKKCRDIKYLNQNKQQTYCYRSFLFILMIRGHIKKFQQFFLTAGEYISHFMFEKNTVWCSFDEAAKKCVRRALRPPHFLRA